MSSLRALILSIFALMIAACDKPAAGTGTIEEDSRPVFPTAASLGEQVVLTAGDYRQLPQYRAADIGYGRNLAMQCRACHSFEEGAPGSLGPNLYGLFGRPAGSVDGFPYSPALTAANFTWTPQALDAWLAQPSRFLPGNSMVYAGLRDREDRDAIIAALLQLTEPAPEQEPK